MLVRKLEVGRGTFLLPLFQKWRQRMKQMIELLVSATPQLIVSVLAVSHRFAVLAYIELQHTQALFIY